jgi:hypothetical protein
MLRSEVTRSVTDVSRHKIEIIVINIDIFYFFKSWFAAPNPRCAGPAKP